MLKENIVQDLLTRFYHEELITRLEPFYRQLSLHMDLESFLGLLHFREEITFFKKTQLEKLITEISMTLSIDIIQKFLLECSKCQITLQESWVRYLGIMLTRHIVTDQQTFKSSIIRFLQ